MTWTDEQRAFLEKLGFQGLQPLKAEACRRCRVALGHPADGPFTCDMRCHANADPAELGCDHFTWVVIQHMEAEA